MVHFQVRPFLSVTYWLLLLVLTFPVAVLFARVTCVPLLFLICFSRERLLICLARVFLARVFFHAG